MVNKSETISGERINSILNIVDEKGNVDYLTLALTGDAAKYVESLETFDATKLRTEREKLAFWINAYNMLVIYGVIEAIKKDPGFIKKGNKGWLDKFRFFFMNKYTIAGKKYSLLDIENWILRKKCNEPRIHFALVCGAGSCPLLKNGLYSGTDIDKELEIATRLFINSPIGARLDKKTNIIYLSRIFKWYRKDFGSKKNFVLGFIARYHSEKEYIEKNLDRLRIRYLDYDWKLNIKR